jgi:hypothetical protein
MIVRIDRQSVWMRRILGATLMLAASLTSVDAQPAASLSEAATQVEVGEKVRVLRLDGSEIRGELSAIDPTALAIDVDGRVMRINAADVREVGVKDGVYNGLLIGMGAGLAAGLVAGWLATSPDDGNLRGMGVTFAGAAGLGVGIGLGAAIDAASARYKTVYGGSTTVRVSPLAAPGRGYGAVVAVGW